MKHLRIAGFIFTALLAMPSLRAQEPDAEGCRDHPMFNRMPKFYINECVNKEFDAYKFIVENSSEDRAKRTTVEGKYYELSYRLN
ncbi:MAG: hypothetical protein ABFD60_03050, partial [Bryobacteraceae bacterium]